MGTMFGRGKGGELRRVVGDFLLALALFWAVALGVSNSDHRAHAVPLPAISQDARSPDTPALSRTSAHLAHPGPTASAPRWGETSREQALALLSLAFAAIAALNLAFWRHLRRVYASPRRSVWRRG
jgi:hypothetical protein